MQMFELEPIRTVDADGVLQGVGIEWTEECSLRHTNRFMMWLAFAMCVPFAFFSLVALAYYPGPGLFGLISFGGMGAYVLYWQLGPLPRRSVIFERDGHVVTPHGIPGGGRIRASQSEIVSIEVGPCRSGLQSDWTSTVKLVSSRGGTTTVSQKLHREEAREVVVWLSHALKEMRSSVGREPMRASRKVQHRVFVD